MPYHNKGDTVVLIQAVPGVRFDPQLSKIIEVIKPPGARAVVAAVEPLVIGRSNRDIVQQHIASNGPVTPVAIHKYLLSGTKERGTSTVIHVLPSNLSALRIPKSFVVQFSNLTGCGIAPVMPVGTQLLLKNAATVMTQDGSVVTVAGGTTVSVIDSKSHSRGGIVNTNDLQRLSFAVTAHIIPFPVPRDWHSSWWVTADYLT